jgi:hypothetical protein
MNPATITRASVAAIVTQLVANIKAVQLPNNAGAAFGEVKQFDEESLVEAFRYLHLVQSRVCVVIALDEKFVEKERSTKLLITRIVPICLLISDRVVGDRMKALYGDSTVNPPIYGADALKELVLPMVTGTLLANPKVVVSPESASVFVVKDKMQQNLPGRSAIALELQCTGGTITANTGPGATL